MGHNGRVRRSVATSLAIGGAMLAGFMNPHPGHAQTPAAPTSFEAASVKPAAFEPGRGFGAVRNDGSIFSAGSVSLKALIVMAYHVDVAQISGGPDWLATAKFDVDAKRPGGSSGAGAGAINRDDKLQMMLQSLLAERFRLAIHRETKELPVYALVPAKTGPKLTEASAGGDPGRFKGVSPTFEGVYWGGGGPDNVTVNGKQATMSELAYALSWSAVAGLDRYVIDATGLKGNYDFSAPFSSGPDSDGPTIFDALERNLGLRLEARKGPVEILVVDHAEKPGEN